MTNEVHFMNTSWNMELYIYPNKAEFKFIDYHNFIANWLYINSVYRELEHLNATEKYESEKGLGPG